MQKFRVLGQGVNTILKSSKYEEDSSACSSVSSQACLFFCVGFCSWNMKREKDGETETDREEKGKGTEEKGKKKTTTPKPNQSHKLKKNPYKIGAHYVFVYFQNVAKLNH